MVDPEFEWTGGGVVTHVADLTKWVRAFYEGEAFDRLLLDDVLATVDYETGQPSETGYGLATMSRPTQLGLAYGHRGIFPGYQTIVEYVPSAGCAVAIQVNADRFSDRLTIEMTPMMDRVYGVIAKWQADHDRW